MKINSYIFNIIEYITIHLINIFNFLKEINKLINLFIIKILEKKYKIQL